MSDEKILDEETVRAWEALLDRADAELEANELDLALNACEEAVALLPDEPDGHASLAHVYLAGGAPEEAIVHARNALRLFEGHTGARALLGEALFNCARFDEATSALEGAAEADPNDATTQLLLAVLEERAGKKDSAERRYRRARKLDKGLKSVAPMSRGEFEAVVEEAVAELPDDVREALANVSVQVQDFPEAELLTSVDPPFDPLLLGLFQGTPLTELSFFDGGGALPAVVLIFQRNLELACKTRDELIEQIRITVVHEIGHYLGLDEDDLEARGID